MRCLASVAGVLLFGISVIFSNAGAEPRTRVVADPGFVDLAPGQTVTGAIGGTFAATGGSRGATASFPVNLPQPLADSDVIIAASTELVAACGTASGCLAPEEIIAGDSPCTGTSAAPTAPEGKLCIYPSGLTNATGVTASPIPPSGKSQGFEVTWSAAATTTDTTSFVAVWAYTAPAGATTAAASGKR